MDTRSRSPAESGPISVRIFAANEHMNQMLIAQLEPAAWRGSPPGNIGGQIDGQIGGKIRTIGAIFSHMHNIRIKWIRLNAPHLVVPQKLTYTRCTPQEASAALTESAAGCTEMLRLALDSWPGLTDPDRTHQDNTDSLTEFRRDGWARPLPAGPEMLCYMLCHEAHHRGQVCMLAHHLGFQLSNEATSALWSWEKFLG